MICRRPPACNNGVNGSATILRSAHGGVAFRLIPREEKFYDDFQALADELKRGARLLEEMLAPDRPVWDKADEIKEVEHKCDFLTHEIIQRLNRTFVTPLDREDIHALARSLDDVMDAIDASATLVRLYRLETRALRRARARAHHHRVHAAGPPRARRAGAAQGPDHARGRDQPARERSRPHAPAGRQPAVRRRARSARRHEVEGDARLPRRRHRSLRGRRQRARRRRWSSTASRRCSTSSSA